MTTDQSLVNQVKAPLTKLSYALIGGLLVGTEYKSERIGDSDCPIPFYFTNGLLMSLLVAVIAPDISHTVVSGVLPPVTPPSRA